MLVFINFFKFPTICPLVRDTVPAAAIITVSDPVVMLPEVSVKVLFIVGSTVLNVTPVELFKVRLLKLVAAVVPERV